MHDPDSTGADGAPAADTKIPGAEFDFLAYAIAQGFDPRKRIKKNVRHVALGQAVLAHMRVRGEELINTPSGPLLYSQGVWSRVNKKWLAVQIEQACRGFDFSSDTKLINETRNWILRQPELWRDGAPPDGKRGARS